jgi:Domain of unknown function (DUF3560)
MYTATYSPQDNKLRLYASERLDAEAYGKLKEVGFIWAPKQDCFVAPAWSPKREDALLPLVDCIEDEDSTLEERATQRAERFEGYSEKRAADAERSYEAVQAISEQIPLGQPILVGHHSEKRARKDAERIENGMRKTVKLWETSEYWKQRASASIRHAKYKEKPEVRARRIKGLQAEARKYERTIQEHMHFLDFFQRDDLTLEKALHFLNCNFVSTRIWSDLDSGKVTLLEAKETVCRNSEAVIGHYKRWAQHTENRIAYETAMLDGWEPPKVERVKRELAPLVNFPSEGCEEMTAAEWKKANKFDVYQVIPFNSDGKRAGWGNKGDYRRRMRVSMMGKSDKAVVITDMPVKYPAGMEGSAHVG